MNRIINKTMELSDLDTDKAKQIILELNDLILALEKKNLKISSWYGKFELSHNKYSLERLNRGYNYQPLKNAVNDHLFPWFLYWEIIWVVLNTEFKKGQKVLDIGGSSSLFSYYLASKGLKVIAVDLQKKLVDNGNHIADQMGWDLTNYTKDINFDSDFEFKFNHITSICVFEHIPMYERININKKIKELLVDGGYFSITFDYRNPIKKAMITTPKDVQKQFVEASGLMIRGNSVFIDTGNSYLINAFFHKDVSLVNKLSAIICNDFNKIDIAVYKDFNDYTFGALFLKK